MYRIKTTLSTSILVTTLVAFSPTGSAQQTEMPTAPATGSPIILVIDSQNGNVSLPAESLREAISNELHVPTITIASPAAQSAQGTLTVSNTPEGQILVVYRDAAGAELWRSLSVPNDPTSAVATVALLVGNLARSEVDEIAGVQRRTTAVVAPPPPAPVPVLAAPEVPPPVVFDSPKTEAKPAIDVAPNQQDDGGMLSDHFSISVSAGYVIDTGVAYSLQANYRLGPLAFGPFWQHQAVSAAHELDFLTSTYLTSDRIGGLVEYRMAKGIVAVDLGALLGADFIRYDTGSAADPIGYAGGSVTVGIGFARNFDFILRAELGTTLESPDGDSDYESTQILLGAGFRGHV